MAINYQQHLEIPCGNKKISCELTLPASASAIIIFSQGSGASITSPRSRTMAAYLQQHGFGTVLPNLFDPEEQKSGGKHYDVELLSRRLACVTQWLIHMDLLHHYKLGYYATSIGASAALRAATLFPDHIGAIVCRGGRPDIVKAMLPLVETPTSFVVGELDRYVLQLNREALDDLSCSKLLTVILGATHLFEGDKQNELAETTVEWFQRHLLKSKLTTPQKINLSSLQQPSIR